MNVDEEEQKSVADKLESYQKSGKTGKSHSIYIGYSNAWMLSIGLKRTEKGT